MPADNLTPKQRLFVKEYIIDKNATRAYKAAYNKDLDDNVAAAAGVRLLRNVKVAEEIDKTLTKIEKKCELSATWVLNNLKEVTERCLQKVPVMYYDKEDKCMKQEMMEDENGIDQGVWTFNANGANRALELIGKHLGLFTEKIESTNTNINAEVTEEEKQKLIDKLLNK